MTFHFQQPGQDAALCGARGDKLKTDLLRRWNAAEKGAPFVNCPECLMHSPARRKRGYLFKGGKFR